MLDGTSEVITCSLLVILFSGMFEVSACSESGTDAYNGSIALDCIGLEAVIDDGSSGADTSDADLESTMNCSNTAVTAQHKLFTTCEYANIYQLHIVLCNTKFPVEYQIILCIANNKIPQ